MTREDAIALLNPQFSILANYEGDDLTQIPLQTARANADASFRAMGGEVSRLPQVHTIPGLFDQRDVEVRVHSPPSSHPKLAVLHVHGGGMVKGSASAMDGRICKLAEAIDAIVVSVAYRLAPETVFPGPLYDCVAAWFWMVDQAPKWALDTSNCVISGDSAGGGLAAATTLYLRDTKAIMPAGQVLVYPMLDYTTGSSIAEITDQRIGWNSRNNQFGWRALLGNQAMPQGKSLGHFSPSHAISFQGLPPTWIGVGTIDLFLDENFSFATAIAKAHGEVQLITYQGAPHGFPAIPSAISKQFARDYRAAFERFKTT